MDEEHENLISTVAASGLVSAAVLAALIGKLGSLGVVSDADTREIYDQALFLIEQQAANAPEDIDMYDAARRIIETQLRDL